jgi:hypothetical protein
LAGVRDQGSLQANGGQEIDDVEAALVECRQAGGTGVVSGGGLLTLAWRGVSNEGADVARADLGYAVCSMHADAGESSGGTVAHGVACSFVRASPQADVEEERASLPWSCYLDACVWSSGHSSSLACSRLAGSMSACLMRGVIVEWRANAQSVMCPPCLTDLGHACGSMGNVSRPLQLAWPSSTRRH